MFVNHDRPDVPLQRQTLPVSIKYTCALVIANITHLLDKMMMMATVISQEYGMCSMGFTCQHEGGAILDDALCVTDRYGAPILHMADTEPIQ